MWKHVSSHIRAIKMQRSILLKFCGVMLHLLRTFFHLLPSLGSRVGYLNVSWEERWQFFQWCDLIIVENFSFLWCKIPKNCKPVRNFECSFELNSSISRETKICTKCNCKFLTTAKPDPDLILDCPGSISVKFCIICANLFLWRLRNFMQHYLPRAEAQTAAIVQLIKVFSTMTGLMICFCFESLTLFNIVSEKTWLTV